MLRRPRRSTLFPYTRSSDLRTLPAAETACDSPVVRRPRHLPEGAGVFSRRSPPDGPSFASVPAARAIAHDAIATRTTVPQGPASGCYAPPIVPDPSVWLDLDGTAGVDGGVGHPPRGAGFDAGGAGLLDEASGGWPASRRGARHLLGNRAA